MPVIQMDIFTLRKVAREAQEEHEDHAQLLRTVNISKYYSISKHTCTLTKLASAQFCNTTDQWCSFKFIYTHL